MQLFCLSQMQTILLNFCSKLCIKKKGESYQSLAERRLEEFTDFLCFLYGAMAATEAIGISLERCRKYRKKKEIRWKRSQRREPIKMCLSIFSMLQLLLQFCISINGCTNLGKFFLYLNFIFYAKTQVITFFFGQKSLWNAKKSYSHLCHQKVLVLKYFFYKNTFLILTLIFKIFHKLCKLA